MFYLLCDINNIIDRIIRNGGGEQSTFLLVAGWKIRPNKQRAEFRQEIQTGEKFQIQNTGSYNIVIFLYKSSYIYII